MNCLVTAPAVHGCLHHWLEPVPDRFPSSGRAPDEVAFGAFDAALAGKGPHRRKEEGVIVFGRGAVALWTGDRWRVPERVPQLL